jgi:hypothetical protein
MDGQHGPDCAGPPNTHHLSGAHSEAVFLCRDHLMTALNAGGYGVIYLTPNQLVNLADGAVTIRFDVSTERMSKRDWIDLWLTPWDENMALPLEGSDPDLQGRPANSFQITTNNSEGSPMLIVSRDGEIETVRKGNQVRTLNEGIGDDVNQAATRQTFQLTLSEGRAKFERLSSETAPGLLFWDQPVDFPFEQAVMQIGHHSYNPTKDNSGVPATWHWDNVGVSSAVPFGIERSIERYADPKNPDMHFENPAPGGSMLRFAATGRVEISTDGGKSWSEADRQDGLGQVNGEHHPEHVSSYWTPVPEGTDSVRFRFSPDGNYKGPYIVEGAAIWSR